MKVIDITKKNYLIHKNSKVKNHCILKNHIKYNDFLKIYIYIIIIYDF